MEPNNNSNYRLKEVPIDSKWDKFVELSSNGTSFVSSCFLKSLDINVKAYFCYKSDEIMAAIICILSADGKEIIGHDFVIYDGLIYKDLSYLNLAQQISERFKILEFVSYSIEEMFQKVTLRLHPSIKDMRGFLWHNYHNVEGRKYIPNILYTAYVNILDFNKSSVLEDIELYKSASVARRQEIRYAIKKSVSTSRSDDIESFLDYYRKTLERQDIATDDSRLNEMSNLIKNLLDNKSGIMFSSENKDGKVGSMAFYLIDNKRAYYLFGVSDPDMRKEHTGTAVLWDSFYKLSELGIKEVDLEGVNSPNRGWFKLSFGGQLIPYYQISLNNN